MIDIRVRRDSTDLIGLFENMSEYKSEYMKSYHRDGAAGANYDRGISNRFELFIFDIEKVVLNEIYARFLGARPNIAYLDYACGTGRILGLLQDDTEIKVGMDTSDDQLAQARARVPDAELINDNIVTNPARLGRKFDLVTCFRLFLNLERRNRLPVLEKLHDALLDDGYLVVDNHMNRYSALGLIALFFRKVLGYPEKSSVPLGAKGIIGTMSEREMRSVLFASGFVVRKTYRFVLLPGHKSLLVLPERLLLPLEMALSKVPILNLVGKNQIYVCQKKSAAGG